MPRWCLHPQRPQSVFEEDEAEEAAESSSSKCWPRRGTLILFNSIDWKVEFLSQPISEYSNRTTTLIPFLRAINHFCNFFPSYFIEIRILDWTHLVRHKIELNKKKSRMILIRKTGQGKGLFFYWKNYWIYRVMPINCSFLAWQFNDIMKIKNWKLAWTCIRNTRFFFFIPPERFFHLLAQHRSFPSFSSASFNIIGHSWPRSYKKMTEYYDILLFRQMLSTFATRVEVNRTIFERVKILLQKIIICGTSLHF